MVPAAPVSARRQRRVRGEEGGVRRARVREVGDAQRAGVVLLPHDVKHSSVVVGVGWKQHVLGTDRHLGVRQAQTDMGCESPRTKCPTWGLDAQHAEI